MLVGLIVLLGWWSGIARFISIAPHWPVMLPNTGLLFIIAGAAAALLEPEQAPKWRRLLGRLLSLFVLVFSGLTLCQYLFTVDLGLDTLLFRSLPAPWSSFPGRPSIQTNMCFFLIGSALLCIDYKTSSGRRPTEFLCLGSIGIAILALLGYIHSATPFYGMTSLLAYTGMAAHTGCLLVVLNAAVLCARANSGGMAILSSKELGGAMARRMLLLLLAVPVLGILLAVGTRAGLYEQAIASALLTFGSIAALITWGLHIASWLNHTSAERRHAHEMEALERRWLETVLDQLPDGIVLSDANGQVELENRALLRLFGTGASEKEGTSPPLRIDIRPSQGESLTPEELPLLRAVQHGEVSAGKEYLARTRDGKLLPVLISAAPIQQPDGNRLGAVMVVQDISAVKEFERLREEWSAVVAHELRQPIAVIGVSVELLKQLHAGNLSQSERLTIERIVRANHHLKRLITDLLDVSNLAAQRLAIQCKPIDLLSVMTDRVTLMKLGELKERPVRIETHGALAPVWADSGRIEQVISNLLSNAGKYGAPGTEICIELLRKEQSIEVIISNQGRGIDPAELPKLFQRFSRSREARESGMQGIGLGLYITKGLIEAHGGRIWAESTPGTVTSFHFTLPLAPGTAGGDPEAPGPASIPPLPL